MGWLKRELVAMAFAEIGLSVNVFNVSPDKLDSGLKMLDAMMATWAGKGIKVGYALSISPDDSELDQESGLPMTAVESVYLNLAVRMAPSFGKQVSAETKISARQGYETMCTAAAQPIGQQYASGYPLGAGNKTWRYTGRTFSRRQAEAVTVESGGSDLDL